MKIKRFEITLQIPGDSENIDIEYQAYLDCLVPYKDTQLLKFPNQT